MPGIPDNYRLIWITVATIPYGRVASYGQIATLAGLPRRARLVGQALRKTPATTRLPWHRVINAQGAIAFPLHSEPYLRQRQLLEAEGVVLINDRIDLGRYGWQPDLDELLWKQPD